MSLMGRIMTFYPLFILASLGAAIYEFVVQSSLITFLIPFGVAYLLPLLSFRLHNFIFPLRTGVTDISTSAYSSWWGGHQIQLIYLIFPQLELILRVIPGAYSFWLRLWGSEVGQNVYWAPTISLEDRSLVKVGDNVVFGHQTGFYGHVVTPKEGKHLLFVKEITIGSNCFIGGRTELGPGCRVNDNSFTKAGTHIYPNSVYGQGHDKFSNASDVVL